MKTVDAEYLAEKYPWRAETPQLAVKPHHVDVKRYGHHGSYVVFDRRVRRWGFTTQELRDRFVTDYKATEIS